MTTSMCCAQLPTYTATTLTKWLQERRDSKTFLVVDEDCGIPTSLVENYRAYHESGPLAQSDPRSILLSMSEYDKQSYDVYGESTSFVATRALLPQYRGNGRRGCRPCNCTCGKPSRQMTRTDT